MANINGRHLRAVVEGVGGRIERRMDGGMERRL